MEITNLIKKFFLHYLEDTIQDIEIISSIRSEKEIKLILKNINKEINFALTSNNENLIKYYEKIGTILYQNHLSLIIILNILEKLKNEIIYAINHKLIQYDENEFLIKIELITQSISKSYFTNTINYIIKNIQKENIFFEIDINSFNNWYIKFLNSLLNNEENKSIVIYEDSECFKWINSLDFKLLTKACDLSTKNEIIINSEKIFETAREIVFYKNKSNYKNAYDFLNLLDQKINYMNNLLKNISLSFINDKNNYFFELFADLITFKKEFTYFLIFSFKPSIKTIHKKDIYRMFFNIFYNIKEKIKNIGYDFTGIINETKYMHFIISYKEKKHIKEIFDSIVKIIENEKEKELILNIPDFYVRAVNTENFSGLTPDILKNIAYIMTKEISEASYYHFKENESKNLIKKAKEKIKFDKLIKKTIENKEIELFFQPIIHIQKNTKKLEYCEILSRINIKNNQIDMQNFIDYIVEEKLTDEFDKLVYEKLITLIPEISKYLKGISLNIFPTSFLNTEILKLLKNILEKCKESNLYLILEITEYNLFKYYSLLKKLKNDYPSVLKIAVDDFGSGYSSFSTLIKLSKNNLLDIIKIDGSITQEILTDEINFDILKMSLEIAKKINKKVIIEFIENKQIEDKIKTITDNFYAQGFLYSKAIPLEKIKKLQI